MTTLFRALTLACITSLVATPWFAANPDAPPGAAAGTCIGAPVA